MNQKMYSGLTVILWELNLYRLFFIEEGKAQMEKTPGVDNFRSRCSEKNIVIQQQWTNQIIQNV
jgi:hypothetical protein